MRQKPISLRKFIETFPEKSFIYSTQNIPNNFNELSYYEKYKFVGINDTITQLVVKSDSIFFCAKCKTVERIGNRFFCKLHPSKEYVYITPSKIVVNSQFEEIEQFLTDVCKMNWFQDIPLPIQRVYFIKPSILRAILTKRIFSEETLYRGIASKCFGIKGIDWHLIKNLLLSGYINILDLKYFTRNLEDSIKVILQNRSDIGIYRDLLDCAVKLNEIVDFTWSAKRINLEHLRQIRLLKQQEISEKSNEPIYEHTIGSDTIKQLNTEIDVYMEGMSMNHCLYTCYYNRIASKKYIAFHMTAPEDCTFSLTKPMGNDIHLDQIFLSHDRAVQLETKKIAEQFLQQHKDELLQMFEEKTNIVKEYYGPITHDEPNNLELPF